MNHPNILWLNSDHYAYAPHFALNREWISAPCFDRLCNEGARFDNAYTVCPLCTPARASLVTGQYPHRHGITNNEGWNNSRREFAPDAPLVSRDLAAAGYRCALFGKWHAVGAGSQTAQECGYEGFSRGGYGYPYHAPEYDAYLRELGLPEPEVEVEWHHSDVARTGRIRLRDEPNALYRMAASGVLLSPVETHEAYFLAHLANRYLEERARDAQPFCLRVDPWGPHHPYFVGAPFAGTVDAEKIVPPPTFAHDLQDRPAHHRVFHEQITRRSNSRCWDEWRPVMARCYEHIALVDAALNSVLSALDHLGLAQSTLVVYSADHGDIIASHGGMFDKGWMMVEETMRIPFAVRAPNVVARGARAELVSNLDIVATIRDVAQSPTVGDGRSVLPLLNGTATHWRDDLMLEHHGHYERPVFQRMLRHAQWKYIAHLDDTHELYDLEADPYELHNRIGDESLRDVRRDLLERLLRRMDGSNDFAPDAHRLRAQMQISS
ncbi:MAG: hypothetical protein JWN98_1851 [Abditibacteriota bacterium]|nr:hypothetical protein [Abditibacteriota bacterium]